MTDTSNRKANKLLPILVRGFNLEEGVKIYKLNVKSVKNETSDTIGKDLIETGKNWKIDDKIIAFGADNCPANFGSSERNPGKNVFTRLKDAFKRKIVGIGCVSHIFHNAFDTACDQLPIFVEPLVVNVYKHFHIYTSRCELLQEFCSDTDVNYTNLVNHSGTRFLSLLPAVSKVRFEK